MATTKKCGKEYEGESSTDLYTKMNQRTLEWLTRF